MRAVHDRTHCEDKLVHVRLRSVGELNKNFAHSGNVSQSKEVPRRDFCRLDSCSIIIEERFGLSGVINTSTISFSEGALRNRIFIFVMAHAALGVPNHRFFH
jgi:hypothetical protein